MYNGRKIYERTQSSYKLNGVIGQSIYSCVNIVFRGTKLICPYMSYVVMRKQN